MEASTAPYPKLRLRLYIYFMTLSALCAGCSKSNLDHQRATEPASNSPLYLSRQCPVTHELPAVFAEDVGTLTHEFLVINDTASTIRFREVGHSCACSKVELERTEVRPGEKTLLRMEINLRNRSGQQSFSSQLASNSELTWSCSLRIVIYKRLAVVPQLLNLGLVNLGTGTSRTAVLESCAPDGKEIPRILAVVPASDHLTASLGQRSEEIQPDGVRLQKTVIPVTLNAQSVAGPYRSELVVHYQDHGSDARILLPVEWKVRSSYVILPPRAFFGRVKEPGNSLVKRITIRRSDGRRINVRSSKASEPSVQCAVGPSLDTSQQQLELTLDPTKVQGPFWGEVILETDDQVEPLIKVPIAAIP
jgi:hypothetical protein